MNTTHTLTLTERSFWRPASRAQWAYAAGSTVAALGLLAVAAPGVPPFALGHWVEVGFLVAFLVGAALERSIGTAIGTVVAVAAGNYVIVTSTHDRAYSHATLAAQFLAIVGVVLLAGSAAFRRGLRAGRAAR